MPVFDARSDYVAKRDVRDHRALIELVQARPQKGVLWPLVGARRAGKTWTLRAVEHHLSTHSGAARYVHLREHGAALPEPPPSTCLLLDEPELTGAGDRRRKAKEFLAWCRAAHAAQCVVLLAMSPAEWVALRAAGEDDGLVSAQDLRFLAPLTEAQAKRLARTKAARSLLATLPPIWKRSPFLLELVFQTAEESADAAPGLLDDPWQLLRTVRDRSDDAEFFYFDAVFHNGLTDAQRDAVQRVARGDPREPPEADLLRRCGLLRRQGERTVVDDPILEANLLPLRIHHVSDLHFGPKSAERVDIKEKGAHAEAMRQALGAPRVADAYAGHVAELAAAGRGPHLLVISGDVAEWARDDELAEARAWLDRVRALLAPHPRLGPGDPHVLLVGGNHDVDWSATRGEAGRRARHAPFARAFEGVPRALRACLETPPEARPLAAARYPELGLEVVLLGSAEFGGEEERDPVRDGLLELVARLRKDALDERDAERAAALGAQVSRIDPGLVHHADLSRISKTDFRQPIRIAVLHHPVSPLPSTELVSFAGLVNAGELKDTLVRKGFCLVLHGHAHTGWFGKEQWPERHEERSLRIAAAPSLGSREVQEHHGYNEIEIAREQRGTSAEYRITVRRIGREGASWAVRSHMGPFAPGS
jgi:3',5'-cyclic AMP phosphodiesterase CpdA